MEALRKGRLSAKRGVFFLSANGLPRGWRYMGMILTCHKLAHKITVLNLKHRA